MKQYEMPGQSDKEVPCYDHPDAPHGFNRSASHGEDCYVCDCKGWFEENIDDVIYSLNVMREKLELVGIESKIMDKQIKFMKGLVK